MVRLIAHHVVTSTHTPMPNEEMLDRLYGLPCEMRGGPLSMSKSHIDLQIGSRVRLTRNLDVGMGLYNGAMGTVYSLVYQGPGPSDDAELPTRFSSLTEYQDREHPPALSVNEKNPP